MEITTALGEFVGQELEWVKPKALKNHYELRAGDGQVVATFDRGGRSASGTAVDGAYTFRRQGFWRRRIIVERAQDQAQGVFAGKTLTLPDGQTITCEKVRTLSNERVWKDASGASLLTVHPASWSAKVRVIVQPAGATLPELSLLVLLAQYLIILAREDEAAAVAAAVVPTTAVH